MKNSFENKIAVVTGAGGTLCSEIAIRLAEEGATVFLVGRTEEKLLKTKEKIVALLQQNSKLSAAAIADELSITAKAVEKHLANLKSAGIIQRIGPAKGGYWEVKPLKE